MKITYDPQADALYIQLREVELVDAIDVEEGVTADLDEDGHIAGLEILDASERLTPEELSSIHYENLLLTMDEGEVIPATPKASSKAVRKPSRKVTAAR